MPFAPASLVMRNFLQLLKLPALFVIVSLSITIHRSDGALVTVVANGPNANVETISQIVFDVTTSAGTSTVTQNAPTTGVTQASSAVLQSVATSSGILVDFSPLTPTITSDTFPATAGNIEVFTPQAAVNVADPTFLTELANVHSTGDLVQYLRVDSTTVEPVWTIEYDASFSSTDYLIIEERNGNTTFEVSALDANGNVIAGSDTLAFNSGSYQWDTGLVNALDPFDNQTQVASVVSFDLFGTAAPVHGFRIENTGRADFKFFIGSTSVSVVPEPTSLALMGMMSIPFVCHRRRRRRT